MSYLSGKDAFWTFAGFALIIFGALAGIALIAWATS